MNDNENSDNDDSVHDFWPFLDMDKGPSREPGTDVLAVWETAADKGGRGDLLNEEQP